MGYKLRRALREALDPDITGLQRAVALEIADDANDDTRRSYAALEDLRRWTAAKDSAVIRNALKRLSKSGWEFRVPIGKGSDERVLYAVPGRRMTFKVPHFDMPEQGGATTTPSEQGVAPAHSEGAPAHSEGAPAPPFSSDTSDTSSSSGMRDASPDSNTTKKTKKNQKTGTQHILDVTNATPQEAQDLLDAIDAEATKQGRDIGTLDGYVCGFRDSDLNRRLTKLRTARAPKPRSGAHRWCTDHPGNPLPCGPCRGSLNVNGPEKTKVLALWHSLGDQAPVLRPDLATHRTIQALETA